MVFRKPYAFFIKMFKPIHLMLAFSLTYLLYIQNSILKYFSDYIYNTVDKVNVHTSILIYIIPILFIIVSVLLLGVMYKKNKPFRFYIVTSLSFVVVIVINIYTSKFLNQLVDNTLPVRIVKLAHDLALINIIIEIIVFVLLVIRGLGVNIKKFDFSSDLLNLDISESDREEFEVSINLDTDLQKRKRKNKRRKIKYKYLENKLLYNIIVVIVLIILVILGIIGLNKNETKKPDYEYITHDFSFKIDDSYIINKNYKGNDINNLIVVNISMLSYSSKSINTDDFSLIIEGVTFKPTIKYSNDLIDIGITYVGSELSNTYTNYLIIFDVPEKYLKSKIVLRYSDIKGNTNISLNPAEYKSESKNISYKLGDKADLKNGLGDIQFEVTEFDIQKSFPIYYDYCRNDYCKSSIEYLKPSIDQNFDKVIARFKVNFTNNSDIKLSSFYDLINKFGIFMYDDKVQYSYFEEIKSTKKNTGYIYIGVNSEALTANSIKLMFYIRNTKVEYVLKG